MTNQILIAECKKYLYFTYLVWRPKLIAHHKLCLIEGGQSWHPFINLSKCHCYVRRLKWIFDMLQLLTFTQIMHSYIVARCLCDTFVITQNAVDIPWELFYWTLWGLVTHICISNLTIIGSDNSLSSGQRQAIIYTNAGILLIRTLGKKFSEILSEISTFSFKKMHLKMSSGKWPPSCLGLNVLRFQGGVFCINVFNSRNQ